jgi:ribose/xylose/arabinose/galactoside ABC-type transport system permease subunit
VPLADLQGLFRIIWWGFALNATTGLLLFIAAAADKAYQEIFYVKLVLIVLALVTMRRLRRTVFGNPAALAGSIPQAAKSLAIVALVLWMGAIVAGRLMAYTTTF